MKELSVRLGIAYLAFYWKLFCWKCVKV